MTEQLHWVNAGNAGHFTLDGTRTYLVGGATMAIVDPGPDVEDHVRALVHLVEDAESVRIVVTHGHPDHIGAARLLADRIGSEVVGPDIPNVVDRVLADGDVVETDAGSLVAVHTPGHTADHLCFHWKETDALFAGDMFLGEGDTTWVAEYPGCVADYFRSLERLRTLSLAVIYPAHGAPLQDPAVTIDRYERHRRERVLQVEEALRALPDGDVESLLALVYGDRLPSGLAGAAARSVAALVDYVKATRDA